MDIYPRLQLSPKLLGLRVVETLPRKVVLISQLSSYNQLKFDYNGHALAAIWTLIFKPKSGDARKVVMLPNQLTLQN